MSAIAIDPINPSRESLWARLEEMNRFSWCRKHEYKQLRALFFDGEVAEYPKEFITDVELFWSPKQGTEHWQAVIEGRKAYIDYEGKRCVVESRAEDFIKKSVDFLLQCDHQYSGMSIEQQLALQDYLGLECRNLRHDRIYFETWLAQVELWLKGEAVGEVELPGMYDCVATHRVAFAYGLLNAAPLVMREGRFVALERDSPWGRGREKDMQFFLTSLSKILLKKYRPPKGLKCDLTPRIQFVERLRADLETGQAPLLFQQVWQLTKEKKKK
ncbi:hypothetical protein SAMN05216214_102108 [Atopomonas hussainii]|uniref:Uncharacterized protein n=1 Tax=Atopomonas hussainii TaxID=1429083 RepID=A0A1H7GRS9_9GAMM|nr:hypothetical protein [Atopomonas hussainii]SEK38595.1 hypothetical protein SAMN05216214_102108 [Atopomonas hussainii]